MDTGEGLAAARYEALTTDREGYLRRARQHSELTIPSLIPPEGWDGTTKLYEPYQGLGATGVRTLGSKLTVATMPANEPFFRYRAPESLLQELEAAEGSQARAKVEKNLSKYEREVLKDIEVSGDRVIVEEAFKHVLVGGNVCIDLSAISGRLFPLSQYVVDRDGRGNVLEAVLHESVGWFTLSEKIREQIKDMQDEGKDEVSVYTHIRLEEDGYYSTHQEILGKIIPSSKARYKKENLPYLFLRYARIDGESYSRSFVEELYGDLQSYETLSQAVVEAGSMAAKVVFLVRKNGSTRVKTLMEAPNGGFVEGDEEDVTALNLEKQADFAFVERVMMNIERRLNQQFMMNSTVQRNAERVTAEEIQYLAEELDTALSGLYSLLAVEFQRPYVERKVKMLTRAKKLPKLPEKSVEPVIVTGLDALSRNQEMRRLNQFVAQLQGVYGPEQIARAIPIESYANKLAASLGFDPADLGIRSSEEVAKATQQEQLMQAMQAAGPSAIQEFIKQYGQSGQLPGQASGQTQGSPPQNGNGTPG